MYIDIECVFDLHLDGTEVKPGEEPRAKQEWLDAINKESLFAVTKEIEPSPNLNYQFRITSNDRDVIEGLLKKYYFRDDPSESQWYLDEYLIGDGNV